MLDTNTHPVNRPPSHTDTSDAANGSDMSSATPIGNTGITRWTEQLAELLSEPSVREDWYVIGSAALLEHNVERHAFGIAQSMAERLDVPLVEWTDHYEELVEPAILYVDRSYWGKRSRKQVLDGDYELVSPELVATLHRILEVFDPANPVIIVLSCYDFTHVPESLRCIGKFDRRFDCRASSLQAIGTEFLQWVGWELCDQKLQAKVKQVGRLLRAEGIGDRRQGLMVAALRRRIRDEARSLSFTDVVHFVLHGTAEFDVNDTHENGLYRSAVHEAGHAVVAMIDSAGDDIPDYAAIGTSHDFAGVTTHSYSNRMEDDLDQSMVLHQIRNSLGGRAAEEIVFGPLGMGTRGNGGDLANVTSLLMEMYLECGMFSNLDESATSTDHLIVAPDDPTATQFDRASQAARDYITTQYRIVLQQLRDNRTLLDAVTHELKTRQLLDSDDFAELWQKHNQSSKQFWEQAHEPPSACGHEAAQF